MIVHWAKPRLPVGFVVAILLLGGCAPKGGSSGDEADSNVKPVVQVVLTKPHRQSIMSLLSVTGAVSPLADHEAKVAPLGPGRVKLLIVNVGQHVSKGQVLAELDPGPVNGQIAQAQATIKADEESFRQAKINYAAQVTTQESSVVEARQNLEAQQVALTKMRAGSRPQEIAQAAAALASAEAALTNANQNLSRSQTLFAEGLLAKKDLEAAQSQQLSAAAQLRSAQEALSLTKEGNRPQDIRAAEIAVQQAQEQLTAAQAAVLQNQSKAEDARIAASNLQNAQGGLQAVLAQKAALTIRSPLTGIVTARPLNVGEWVDTSGSVASVADLNEVRLMLNVPISQASEVRQGMDVEFTSDSSRGLLRRATVTVVGKASDPSTNTIIVEARASNQDLSLQDDTFVHAQIVLDQHLDALVVPSSALVQKDDKTVVFVVGADSVAHSKDVRVGLQQNGMSEVSGIGETDSVATDGAYELDDGTKVKSGS